MTDTDQAEPLAEYPEQIVRFNFPFEDARTVSGHWTAWDEGTRREFVDLTARTRPSDVVPAIAGFLADHNPDQPADLEPEPPAGTKVDPDDDDDLAGEDDEVPPPAGDPAADPDPGSTGGGTLEHEIHTALKTAETAKAWADAHPDDIQAMIDHESSDAGAGRKGVLRDLRARLATKAT